MRSLAAVALCLFIAAPLSAQREKREPLTEAQIEQIREAGLYPVERIDLYTKFLNEHADQIKQLDGRAHSAARGHRLDDALQDFTALMDELGSNLDMYQERKADIRKALKPLREAAPRWLALLHALSAEPADELARKEAIESGEDLTAQLKSLLDEQTAYFNAHKDEKGQEREDSEQQTANSMQPTFQLSAVNCKQWPSIPSSSFSKSTVPCDPERRCRPLLCASAALPR
jgi:chromosome segregation ATPase